MTHRVATSCNVGRTVQALRSPNMRMRGLFKVFFKIEVCLLHPTESCVYMAFLCFRGLGCICGDAKPSAAA